MTAQPAQIVMPTPYAVGPVNAYLLPGEPLTLVDCGIDTPEAKDALVAGFEAAGPALGDVRRILVTHAHPDHYGLAGMVQEASGATIYFPRREIARVRDKQMLFEVGRLLLEAGMPLDLLFRMDRQRRKGPRARVSDEVVPIDEGDTFDFEDGRRLMTLHMPGHTGGHVVFLEEATGVLFAGDQLLPDVSPNPLLEPSLDEPGERRRSLKEYLGSLERMRGLKLSIAYPGHGNPIPDPQGLIDWTIEHHLKRKVEIGNHLTPEPKSPYDLARELYPHVREYDIFLAVSEVIAHLDLVVEDGGAVVEDRDGVAVYSSAPV